MAEVHDFAIFSAEATLLISSSGDNCCSNSLLEYDFPRSDVERDPVVGRQRRWVDGHSLM